MQANETPPFMLVSYKGEQEVVLSLIAPGLKPGQGHEIKNGYADVIFLNNGQGMDAKIVVKEGNGKKAETTVWRMIVRKFPSRIDKNKSFWTVDKNKVIITLTKAPVQGQSQFLNWEPLVYGNNLDQYREEDKVITEDQVAFDPTKDVFPTTNITIVARTSRNQQFVSHQPP